MGYEAVRQVGKATLCEKGSFSTHVKYLMFSPSNLVSGVEYRLILLLTTILRLQLLNLLSLKLSFYAKSRQSKQ